MRLKWLLDGFTMGCLYFYTYGFTDLDYYFMKGNLDFKNCMLNLIKLFLSVKICRSEKFMLDKL